MVRSTLLLSLFVCVTTTVQAQNWSMKGHDSRRTGQSTVNGPAAVGNFWVSEAPGAFVVNIGATVTQSGAYWGSWGLLRNDSLGRDTRFWDKSDGRLYGLNLNTGEALWGGPLDLDITHRCYEFDNRARTGDDTFWCGFGNDYHVSFYNGTVEGQAAYDNDRGVMYWGRGDGKLYAIDPDAGLILWRFVTFNPALPADPDGGGEIISSPVVGPDGTIYFATWGIGPYETHAFYAVSPDSSLLWRFPKDSPTLTRPVFTSPAIAPDSATIYFGTFFADNKDVHGKLFALNLEPKAPIDDAQRLKWEEELSHNGQGVWTTTLAVGGDGTLYVGGLTLDSNGVTNVPVVFAFDDGASGPVLKWAQAYTELRDGAQWVGGIALREVNGHTERVYAATTNFRPNVIFQHQSEAGSLFALDPSSGVILAGYDPSDDLAAAVGGLNGPAIGADGSLYFGVRGKFATNAVDPVNGQVFAVAYDALQSQFNLLWHFEVDGHLEWNHPAIGPDGGIYIASSEGSFTDLNTYDQDHVPDNSTGRFYAIKGPATTVQDASAPRVPRQVDLQQNYPNPFNPETMLTYHLDRSGHVRLAVYGLLGQTLRILVDTKQDAGAHSVTWDGRAAPLNHPVPSGLYVYELRVDNQVLRKKMLLIR